MTDMTPDTNEVRNYWANKVGEWSQWADPMAKLAGGLNKPLLDALNIQADSKVLDLASGVGEPAFSAAQLAGPSGLTIASDLVPEMLTALKKREGSEILNFSAADMQNLPFADNSFDHIACRFGVMFVPDQQQSINECFRVNKSGGNLAYLVWGPKEKQRIFEIIGESIQKLFTIEVDHDYHRIFSLADEGLLSDMLVKAGYEIAHDEMIEFKPVAPEGVKFWTSQLDMSFGHLIGDLDTSQREELDREIENRLQEFKLDSGGYQMYLSVRLVSGVKR